MLRTLMVAALVLAGTGCLTIQGISAAGQGNGLYVLTAQGTKQDVYKCYPEAGGEVECIRLFGPEDVDPSAGVETWEDRREAEGALDDDSDDEADRMELIEKIERQLDAAGVSDGAKRRKLINKALISEGFDPLD